MPDFDVKFASGTDVQEWTDPPLPAGVDPVFVHGKPSRLSPTPGHPFLHHVATIGQQVEVQTYVWGLGWGPPRCES